MEETKPFLGRSDIWQDPNTRKRNLTKEAITHLITFIVASVFWWLIWTWPSSIFLKTTPATILTCGNSTQEAKQLGCVFDVLSKAWVPQSCYNEQVTKEFQQQVAWLGYDDLNGTQPLDLHSMSERAFDQIYYTSHREHVIHCVYMWIYQHIQGRSGGYQLNEESRSLKHTRHCAKTLIKAAEADPLTLDDLRVANTIAFATCYPPI